MKLYTLIFTVAFLVIGCSSSDDNSSLDDSGTVIEDSMAAGDSGTTTNDSNTTDTSMTTGGSTTDPLTELPVQLEKLLLTVFETTNGQPFALLSAYLDKIGNGRPLDLVGFPFVSDTPSDAADIDFVRLWNCPAGGEVRQVFYPLEGPRTFIFNNCNAGGYVVTGQADGEYFDFPGGLPVPNLPGFKWTCANTCSIEDTQASVLYEFKSTEILIDPVQPTDIERIPGSKWASGELLTKGAANDYRVQNLTIDEVDDEQFLNTGEFALNTNIEAITLPDGSIYKLETDTNFVRSITLSDNPGIGHFTLSNDTQTLTLNADSGDANTFLLTVNKNETQTAYLIPWSDSLKFIRIDPANINIEF